MSLNYSQLVQLRRIEVGLRRSDPHLGAMFGIFGRLYPDRDLPTWEQPQLPSGQGRIRRAAAWIAAVLTSVATAIGARLSWAVSVAAARWPNRRPTRRQRRAEAPAAAPPGGNGDRRAA
jgi:hypothetical protein